MLILFYRLIVSINLPLWSRVNVVHGFWLSVFTLLMHWLNTTLIIRFVFFDAILTILKYTQD